jgi:hypothetical protein
MYSVLDWYRMHRECIEPIIILLLFYGITIVAFPNKQMRILALALGALLGFSYLEWAEEHRWETIRWGLYGAALIYLLLYCTARNLSRNTKTEPRRNDHYSRRPRRWLPRP